MTRVPLVKIAFTSLVTLSACGMNTVVCMAEVARPPEAAFDLIPVVTQGLQSPLFLTHAGDGSGQLFVVVTVSRSPMSSSVCVNAWTSWWDGTARGTPAEPSRRPR